MSAGNRAKFKVLSDLAAERIDFCVASVFTAEFADIQSISSFNDKPK